MAAPNTSVGPRPSSLSDLAVVRPSSDLSLDTQLELLRGREYMEYKYQSLPEYKDGSYKGQWMNGKPHGRWDRERVDTYMNIVCSHCNVVLS